MSDMSSKSRPENPSGTSAPRKPRQWLIPSVLTLIALGTFILILLPVAVQYGLRNWLLENGAQRVEIADVDLNVFTGTAQLKGVRIDINGHPSLTLDTIGLNFAWQALLQRHITLTGIHLRGTHIDIQQNSDGEWRVGGVLLPTQNADAALEQKAAVTGTTAGWAIGVDALSLTDVSIHYTMPKLELDARIQRLSLKNLAQWTPDKPAQVLLQADINGASLNYNGGLAPFADTLRADGRLDLRGLALADFQQIAGLGVAEKLDGVLNLKTDFSLKLGDKATEAQLQRGDIQLSELRLVTPDIQLQQQTLSWVGDLTLRQADTLRLSSRGTLAGEKLNTLLPTQKLAISQRTLQLGVEVTIEKGEGDPRIKLLLDKTQIGTLAVTADGFPLAGMQQLTVNTLAFTSPQTLSIDQADIDQLYVAKPASTAPALFRNRHLHIENLALTDAQTIRIDKILLKGANTYISRAADESTNIDKLLAVIDGLTGSGAAQIDAAQTSKDTATFHIGHLQLSDDSGIVIDDAGITPTTRIDIGIANLSIDNLDNRTPNAQTTFQAAGKFGRFGNYTFSGEAQPFADTVNGRLSADIKGIDLPRLSPYTTRSLGFRLRSGTLASDINVVIKQNRISGDTELTLHQLELIPLKTKQGLSGDMTAASLNTSLNMLRDKNNTIVLKIPLSGDINAPDFSIQSALDQALMKGVQTGVMTYALLALQPYGTMVVLAKYAGEAIARLRLDPVTFSPAGSEISATGKDYLTKVATILIDRPKVDVKVCGVAVDNDATALQAARKKATEKDAEKNLPLSEEQLQTQLKQLARQRSIAVREFLINQTKAASTQLISCMPAIERGEADALPRVDLLI